MKYFVILLVLFAASILSVNHAYGIWIPQSPEELLEESQVIVVGNITTVNELELEQPFSSEFPSLILDEYTITVEEFVKNPQDTDTLTVRQPTVSTPGRLVPHGGFETGDRVLLYIESFDGTNTYSKESFLIPKQCDTSSVIRAPRIIGSDYTMIQNGIEKKDNFTANTPIQFIAKSDMGTLSGDSPSIEYDAYISKQVGKIYKERVFHQTVTADAKPCEWLSVAEWEFTPDAGNYLLNGFVHKEKSGYSISNTFFSVLPESPLKQIQSGIPFEEIQCKQNLVLVQKYDGTPACVTESTKTKLIERGWTGNNEDQSNVNDTNTNQNDLQKQNIIRIEDGRISLYPESTCASISLQLLAEKDIQRYKNDERGLNATNVLPITTDDFDEIPILEELIYAVNLLEFPYNKHSSVYMDGLTFVEYEFFLMDKAIQKYGDSQGDYFLNLDSDYEERFSNPKKQGFTNHFIAPLIVYNENVYSIDGVYFWTADEHNPKRMGVYPKDSIGDDEKFIMLTEDDMKSIPKIKQAIKEIGTIKESIHGIKGVSEGTQNEYMQWLKEKSQERLGSDRFRLVEYDNQFYAISFLIC